MKKLIFNSIILITIFAQTLFIFPIQKAKAFDYVINDTTFYPIPNTSRPAKGVPYTDPVFHTTITRITDAPTDAPSKYNYAQPGYPKHDIENADGTKLIIQTPGSGSGWSIWNANPPYNRIKTIPSSLVGWGSAIDPRWDRDNPDILYWMYRGLCQYNVTTGEYKILHDFTKDYPEQIPPAYIGASLQEEGDASDDRRYWGFNQTSYDPNRAGDHYYSAGIIVYDKEQDKIISRLTSPNPLWTSGPGFVSMSPSGLYVWTGDTNYIFPRDFSTKKGPFYSGHSDMAISSEGKEVIVGAGHYYKGGYTDMGIWAFMADIETGQITWLTPIEKGAGVYHVSGNSYAKPGWAVFSVYGPTYPTVETNWAEHSIFMVELTTRIAVPDNTNHARVWRVAHSHTKRVGYGDDQFAKINRKGTKIFFGSGWGTSSGDAGYQYDVYQIDLPANWYQDLMTFNIITSFLPSGTVGTAYSQTLQASGGTTPYTWSITSGSLPAGLSLNSSAGAITGTPSTGGTSSFIVQLKDATNQTATKSFSIAINVSDATPPQAPTGVTVT